MTLGTVKWFNSEKGYGFIEADDGVDDIFVRFSEIQAEGYRTLAEGQRVEFQLAEDVGGAAAEHVRGL